MKIETRVICCHEDLLQDAHHNAVVALNAEGFEVISVGHVRKNFYGDDKTRLVITALKQPLPSDMKEESKE